jgi:Fe-S protein assembly co-chaperone HscB
MLFSDNITSRQDDSNSNEKASNYFHILSVPQTFQIDELELKRNYHKLMNEHHPDKRQPSEDDRDEDYASVVTLAYDTLKRPHLRAQHLLALETGRENSMMQDFDEARNADQLLGMETLMEIMELREAIEAVEPGNDKMLAELLVENDDRMDETSLMLEDAFRRKDYEAALSLTARMQYWNRIHETIREKMQ